MARMRLELDPRAENTAFRELLAITALHRPLQECREDGQESCDKVTNPTWSLHEFFPSFPATAEPDRPPIVTVIGPVEIGGEWTRTCGLFAN